MTGILSALAEPISAETRQLLQARWEELPEELQTGWQVIGQQFVHCGYTLGASYCSLGCTHCYLPANANHVPLPTWEEMREQIDANRRLLGPGGALQITGGDVVDAYWRGGRPDELIRIIRYSADVGLVPMVMTHGQLLLDKPDYLVRLVGEGGLRKLAIHIDMTQAGRAGYPIKSLSSEADLHPLREAFVDLVLDVQRRTKTVFYAAHTVTVTERNIDSIGEIIQWLISDPRHLRAFRMISFQPEADVGRTRLSKFPATPEKTWSAVETAVGQKLSRDNMWFGHPDCSNMTTLLVLYPERRVVNMFTADHESRAYWSELLRVFGGIGSRGENHLEENLRRAGLVLRHPSILWKTARFALKRLREEGLGPGAVWKALRGRAAGLNVVMHNFMSESQVAQPRSETVEKRLAACSLRTAVKRDDEWVAVPMCSMNVEEREALYRTKIEAGRKAPGAEPLRLVR